MHSAIHLSYRKKLKDWRYKKIEREEFSKIKWILLPKYQLHQLPVEFADLPVEFSIYDYDGLCLIWIFESNDTNILLMSDWNDCYDAWSKRHSYQLYWSLHVIEVIDDWFDLIWSDRWLILKLIYHFKSNQIKSIIYHFNDMNNSIDHFMSLKW